MKFLVVDDSPTMRRIICNSLRELGYSEFEEANDGKEAIQKLNNGPFDFVITDWNMPNMNGLDLTLSVRNHPKLYQIPVLMVTTRGMQEDVLEAVEARVSNYMVKPFTPEILKDKIETTLRRS